MVFFLLYLQLFCKFAVISNPSTCVCVHEHWILHKGNRQGAEIRGFLRLGFISPSRLKSPSGAPHCRQKKTLNMAFGFRHDLQPPSLAVTLPSPIYSFIHTGLLNTPQNCIIIIVPFIKHLVYTGSILRSFHFILITELQVLPMFPLKMVNQRLREVR